MSRASNNNLTAELALGLGRAARGRVPGRWGSAGQPRRQLQLGTGLPGFPEEASRRPADNLFAHEKQRRKKKLLFFLFLAVE